MWDDNSREFVLVDRRVVCHVCQLAWVQRWSLETRKTIDWKPTCPTPEKVALHVLTDLPASALCEACVTLERSTRVTR